MTHDEFEASAKKFCDEFNARLAATQDWNEIEALRKTFRRHMDEVRKLPAALAEGAMQRLTDTQDWDELEALRESLREHMVKIHRLRAALAEDAMQRLTDVQQEMERKPLTIGQLFDLYNEHAKCQQEDWLVSGWLAFAHAIERAHGIGGEE